MGICVITIFAAFSSAGCSRSHDLHFKKEADTQVLYTGGSRIGHILPFTAVGIAAEDYIESRKNGIFRVTRIFRTDPETELSNPRLTLDFVLEEKSDFKMIPAVSYDGNHWGRGKEPKGFLGDGRPWSFAYHRTSVPGATYAESENWSAAFFSDVDPEQYPFSCSLIPADDSTVHRLIWPEEEQPQTYSSRDAYSSGYQEESALQPGDQFAVTAWLVVLPLAEHHQARSAFLDLAWELNLHPVNPWYDPQKIWKLGITYAKNRLWTEEEVFQGFSIGLRWNGQAWIQRPVWKYEIGWCGQNASLANSLLTDYLRSGDESSLEKGIACLDTWAEHAPLPNGLIRCHFDYILGEEGLRKEVQDACNLGTAARNFFEAFHLAADCGQDRPDYRTIALGICDFAVSDQEDSGRFGKAWTNDGTCVDREGTIGAFLIPPLLDAYAETGQNKYLDAANKGFSFYFKQFQDRGFTTAGALDTYCIDKESAMPLLRSALKLFDQTDEEYYIEAAEQVSYYLATWQWHHTIPFTDSTRLGRLDYDSFGGTSVSTQHHHMDPYALYWVTEWLQLAELTGRDIWRQRALAVWANGSFGISDGTLDTGEGPRPAGSQGEAFFQTRWGFDENFGYYNNWLVAWPTAFRLETLRRIKDWNRLSK